MSREWNVAVVGATGLVGGTMLSILEQREFPVEELFPLASARSVGRASLQGTGLPVQDLETFDFSRADIGLFSAGARSQGALRAAKPAPRCVVIDNTSQFRYQDDIPLVVHRGESARDRRLPQAQHHRQPELLDDADAGGAEAAARRGADRAHQRRDLPVGVGRRQEAIDELASRPRRSLHGRPSRRR